MRRKFFNRLIRRSMMLRCRYASRSKSGWRRSLALVGITGGDAALAQGLPDAPAAVGLVAGQLGRPQARPPPADAADRAAVDQGGDLLAVMHLPAGQREGDRLAVALAAHMDLGR